MPSLYYRPYPEWFQWVFIAALFVWTFRQPLVRLVGSVGPASRSFNRNRWLSSFMATDEADGTAQYEIPDTEEYEQETSELRDVELPVMGFALPVYHRPPGRLMAVMEEYGLSGLFGPGEADMDDMVRDDGEITLNTFMRTEVVPNVAVEQTNKDVVHWADEDVAADDSVDDFDLSALKDEDLAALIKGMMLGDEDMDPEGELEKFHG